MRFAFVIHPLASGTESFIKLDDEGGILRRLWGTDPLGLTGQLHEAVQRAKGGSDGLPREIRIVDELTGLVSPRGSSAEGRLYEIPMDVVAILDDPDRALTYIAQAVQMAGDWGARIVGLGSLTGIVGGRGTIIAESSPIAVTTGNSLTAYTALTESV